LPFANFKELLNLRKYRSIPIEWPAQKLRDHLPGTIIARRPKTSGSHNEIGAPDRFGYDVRNGAGGIIDRHLALDEVSVIAELAAEPLLMRIQDPSKHQFRARIDNVQNHGASLDIPGGSLNFNPAALNL
jgi:hypothetical protein